MGQLLKQLRCWLTKGHRYKNSHARPGYLTCERCKWRKRL